MSQQRFMGGFRFAFALLLFASTVSFARYASAQEAPKPPEPTPEEIAAAEGKLQFREQTIYIPYGKLKALFEKEGRGVFVPYEKFQEMWNAARAASQKVEDHKPPIAFIISEIESEATISRDVMNVTAKLQIEVLAEGWQTVHLRLKDAAIRSASIGGKPARLLFEADKGYWVLIEKKGKQPEKVELTLEYSKAFTKSPGTNSVQFDAPQAPVNRWQIRIPESGVKVNIQPNLAASDSLAPVPAEDVKPEDVKPDAPKPPMPPPAAKETRVEALVGSADHVRIEWTAKAEGAAGLTALATVEARQEVVIDEGVVRTRAHLAYEITRADVTQLVVEVPADHNVVNVFDPNVQKWEKKTEGPIQTITITLFQPTRGTQNIAIELEKFAGDKEMPQEMMNAELKAPVVRATQVGQPMAMVNVGRQQGVVVVRLGTALRGEVTSRTGLLQIDASDLPGPLARQEWSFAYRYAALPFDLTISVEKLLPQIEVEELVETYVEPTQITTNLLAILNIQKAGVFQVLLDVPVGYEVRTVQGRDAAGASAVSVDSHHPDDVETVPDPTMPDVKVKQKTRLVVNLSRKAIGRVALWVELQKRQEDPNLLTPTGKASVLSLPLPRVNPASVARTSGRMIVYAPESLRLTPKELKGLRAIAPAEALQGVESTRAARFPQLRELAAYAYTQEPASLIADAERRKPYIEARQLLSAHIESGVVKYEVTFFFDIRFSGVKTLRIDVPEAIAADIRNLTPAIREQRIEPQPEDVAAGYVAWQLTGEGELLGSVSAKFGWEKKLDELPIGKGVAIPLPKLRAVGADRAWGQITASKAETIEISVDGEPQGLRPIDPQRDLMPGASVPDAARAFEFHDDWSLALLATRYELEEVKRTSIERAFVRMVVTRGDQVSVQALYRLRSARQRIAIKLPGVDPKDSVRNLDSQPLRINNQSAPLEKDQTQFYIPLTGHSADEDVLVELRYTLEADESQLQVPEFPEDPAVQKVHLAVYLPEEWALLGVGGPWTNESSTTFIDRAWRGDEPTDGELLNEVRRGIANSDSAGDNFPTDGQRHLFSALRPEAGPAGALRLTAVHRDVANVAIFLIVAIIGLVLTAWPVGARLWYLAGLVILIVLAAAFAPTFARAMLGDALWLALALVLLVWLVRFLAWFIPQVSAWMAMRPARAAAAAAVVAAASTATPPPSGEPPAPPDQADSQSAGESPFAQNPPASSEGQQQGGSSNG